ncbi:cupin domain-containing protein [Metabacillus arenae]|uniref:Cupin domain-containing protein n=1 Tax=Metabacillus arenae TaxID=2771434 RepID=A0A926RXH4_9BACI|nr:cupin domain-containing protein [Metabacillus arenae]MBD1381001.1 cupin domain-containing protein [Metabacillus arenae]
MKIIKGNEVKLDHSNTNFFTGDVMRGPLLSVGDSKDFVMGVVNFSKGVRNKFHTHSSEQILIITDGEGIVATENEEWKVSRGDIVCIPSELKHWHGASNESNFSHIAIVYAEATTTQVED